MKQMRNRLLIGLCATLLPSALVAGCDTASPTAMTQTADFARGGLPGAPSAEGAVFVANLKPLNAGVTDKAVTGKAVFTIENGTFTAQVDVKNAAPGQPHPQHIHAGDACPKPGADTDGDGLISVFEGAPAYGLILVPLDDSLAAQAPNTFPIADSRGRYSYEGSEDLDAILASLRDGMVPNPTLFRDLNEGEMLTLETRHVVVHGAFVNGAYRATLPVACGTITRVQ